MRTRHAAAAHVAAPTTPDEAIARGLDEVADLLERQRANQYRVQAWRNGAAVVRHLDEPVGALLAREGLEGLDRLPGIGPALAHAIHELATTGRLALLDRLRGDGDPTALVATVPGIGAVLARRIHDAYGIETLEELELAAHDGRLARLGGFGPKRIAGIVDALAGRLAHRGRGHRAPAASPPVAEVLDVDREYRERARDHRLARIAPRRFNPTGRAWLPVLHTRRGDRHYTALFSNSALAHRVGRTDDWVVLYHDAGDGERQCTVVTERNGALANQRVVRGREDECLAFYRDRARERRRA